MKDLAALPKLRYLSMGNTLGLKGTLEDFAIAMLPNVSAGEVVVCSLNGLQNVTFNNNKVKTCKLYYMEGGVINVQNVEDKIAATYNGTSWTYLLPLT